MATKKRDTRRTTVSEFEGQHPPPKTRVMSESILTNWREDEREDYGEGK